MGKPSIQRADAVGLLAALLIAAHHAFAIVGRFGRGFPGFDVFTYTHPNSVYAHEALRRGYGLLWNDLQNCGQPFFAIISTALLYPVNFLSFVFEPDAVLGIKLFLNLAIGSAGCYLLCRELGIGPIAAFCGVLAFDLGGSSAFLARTSSVMLAGYAWLPWAALLAERILRDPGPGAGIGLGIVLALQVLAGFPQTLFFTYQWLALRAFWELVTKQSWPRARPLTMLGLGMALGPLLAAMQLLPSLELAADSIRGQMLAAAELRPQQIAPLDAFRAQFGRRVVGAANMLPVVGVALLPFAFAAARARRVAAFVLLASSLHVVLAFVPAVLDVYRALLPMTGGFRAPIRFLWMASFGFAILVAFGADGVSRKLSRSGRFAAVGASVVAVVSLNAFSPGGFSGWDWGLVAATAVVVGYASHPSARSAVAAVALSALLGWNLQELSWHPVEGQSHARSSGAPGGPIDPAVLRSRQEAFEYIRERITPQSRMYQFGGLFDYSIIPKSASIFGIPSAIDYEPQTSLRWAGLFVRMLTGTTMQSVNQFYYRRSWLPSNRELFDLMAVRYVVADTATGQDPGTLRPPLEPIAQVGTVQVYENPRALPRAFYVPQARVIGDADRVLERLASRAHRPRRVALIEEKPRDGFLGSGEEGSGEVQIVSSRGEETVILVRASREGFLVLSDQFYPGWEATVDGVPIPIYRANYAFRLVRVPQGESTVVFRYRPKALLVGASVTALTLACLGAYWLRRRPGRDA